MKSQKTPHLIIWITPAIAAGLVAFIFACGKKDPAPVAKDQPVEAVPLEPQAFLPPEDGLLTEDQVRRFILAHQAMTEINGVYLDKLVGAPAERQRLVYQALDLARDKVTRKFGLNGFAEYRWILEDAPRRAENVRILERMNVTTVSPK